MARRTHKCRECGGLVSNSAKKCPHCGATKKKPVVTNCAGCSLLLLGFMFIILIPTVRRAHEKANEIQVPTNTTEPPSAKSRSKKKRSSNSPQNQSRTKYTTPPSQTNSSESKKWYSGGTLHSKSALQWQVASKQDKLATCADFVAKMWKKGNLNPSVASNIATADDIKPYAQELVDFLDAAFKRDPDPSENQKLYANQTVSGHAVIGMVMMGWTIKK